MSERHHDERPAIILLCTMILMCCSVTCGKQACIICCAAFQVTVCADVPNGGRFTLLIASGGGIDASSRARPSNSIMVDGGISTSRVRPNNSTARPSNSIMVDDGISTSRVRPSNGNRNRRARPACSAWWSSGVWFVHHNPRAPLATTKKKSQRAFVGAKKRRNQERPF